MKKLGAKLRDEFSVGLIASVLVHVAIFAALLINWNFETHQPEQEEAVSVEIVQPPEEQAKDEQAEPEPPPAPEPEEEQPAEEEPAPEPPPPPPPSPPAENQTEEAAQQTIEPLKPVFEFGEEASGPEVSQNGNASEGEVKDAPDEEPPADVTEEEAPPEPTAPLPSPPELTADAGNTAIAEIIEDTKTEKEKQPETVDEKPEEQKDDLKKVATIYSETGGGNKEAVTAMANLPRGIRGGQLCATELREQLRHAATPYNPEILPTYRFPEGNVLQVNRGAFRNAEGWYNIRFRCEINKDGTKITSFAYEIGDPIPRAEWAKRGLPSN
ncbi:DUF930 domain-containing protein [Rhizobium sp. L1K21]|uniref:DUF930 domain-containing protein n=1 Tax=Rhizobium sp. L1K21 TaxID=2954933 RepID=UPI002091EA06|nr:DUF930 domain-containing protein [Rhizobium sp. L1K21]MCO6185513.1 DUF930 domain-containing protein [Rhizobium sp. L1K21]